MAFTHSTNTATAATNAGSTVLVKNASVSFDVTDALEVTITKTVDQPDTIYYNGQTIIFTISMTRNSGVTGAINNLALTDTFPSTVSFNSSNVKITEGTGGNISVTAQNLTITNLVLNNGNPKITVQVTGTIVAS